MPHPVASDPPQPARAARRDATLWGFGGAAVLLALLFSAGIYGISLQQGRAQQLVGHTYEVLAGIASARADLVEMQNGQRGFAITGRDELLAPYEAARQAILADVRHLRELTADNPLQQQNVARLEAALQPRLASAESVIALRRERGFEAARALLDSEAAARQMQVLGTQLQTLSQEESRLLAVRLAQQNRQLQWFWGGVAALLVGLLAALAVVVVQQRRRQAAEHRLLESERRFHLMTDAVRDYAIYMLDANGHVLTWNTGAAQIKGYAPDEIIGRHFSAFYTPEDRAAAKPEAALATAAAAGHYAEEGWRIRKDGSRLWATIVITALRDATGRVDGYCKITRDLTESRRAQEAQRARELSARLIAAQEEERRHIARELHDETGQALTLLRMQLEPLAREGGAAAAAAAECGRLVDGAIAHIRGLSLRLRPPMLDDLGLPDALEWLTHQQARGAGWEPVIEIADAERRLPREFETTCFRIAQEALTNAVRYSGASAVRVSLRVNAGRVELEIRDNGRGFDLARYRSPEERTRHFGLVSMHERAAIVGGWLEIETAPGRGTCVRAVLPLPADVAASAAREGASVS